MNPVRPPSWPQAAASPVNRAGSSASAQKAFFDAALGRAGGGGGSQPTSPAVAVAAVQPKPPAPNPAASARTLAQAQAATDEATRKVLRPGSLLDIRV